MVRPIIGFWNWDSAMVLVRDLLMLRVDYINPTDELGETGPDYNHSGGHKNGGHQNDDHQNALKLSKPKEGENYAWLLW